ncbi:MAG: hypothetical protein Q4F30_10400 [Akkermansia sp.]|nr:hypothetical protein [Akkermansia sp.]
MNRVKLLLIAGALAALGLNSCMKAPDVSYYDDWEVKAERQDLFKHLLGLLPPQQQYDPAAMKEATWLTETAFKASISIARHNNPKYMNWLNNRLVNTANNSMERGLCWHYQADLYRELRRRPLKFFYLGCCTKNEGLKTEHNALYIRAIAGAWPDVVVLDPWQVNGRLTVIHGKNILMDRWKDMPLLRTNLATVYKENHSYPIEHWERVQSDDDPQRYVSIFTKEGRESRQGRLMFENIERGKKLHPGKLTDY